MRNNPYYEPYWLEEDQNLEHYGTKGMHWGNKKKKKSLTGQSLLDTKVIDTFQWIKDNKKSGGGIDRIWNSETKTLRIAEQANVTVRKGAEGIKSSIHSFGKNTINNLNKAITSKGDLILKKFLKR